MLWDIPKWDNPGQSPPEQKKTDGWAVGDKPPADWLNWFMNKTSENLTEAKTRIETNTAQLADMVYQTPTVVGTQIQIQKQGANNRLFFKLDSDLSGAITISLDGGTTSLPVKDIDENTVTSMSKGFVEVVYNTTFFTHAPKGGINETLPAQVDNFNAGTGNGKIELTWTMADTTYLDGYVFTYKAGSVPTTANDGTKVTAIKTATSLSIIGLSNGTLYYVRAFPHNAKKQYQSEYKVVSGTPKASQPLSALPVGAKIKMGTYAVEASSKEPIIWKIADKNHAGYPANSVTLITDKIIDFRGFDAKEPTNSDTWRKEYGNNRYLYSNIRQWLNKASKPWFSPAHAADATPNDAGMNQPTGYDDINGFLSNFSASELGIMMNTNIVVTKCNADGGGTDTMSDKIFLASESEVGGTNNIEGVKFSLFTDNTSKKANSTVQSRSNSLTQSKPFGDDFWRWWLRTADPTNTNRLVDVNAAGEVLSGDYAISGRSGVRPLCNVKDDALVALGSDGCYALI